MMNTKRLELFNSSFIIPHSSLPFCHLLVLPPSFVDGGLRLAEQQVSQRWATYEEMAARSPEWFPASGDGSGSAATAGKEGNNR